MYQQKHDSNSGALGSATHLSVWREVARHIDLSESLPQLHAILRADLPLEGVRVDRVDTSARSIHTIATTGSLHPLSPDPGRIRRRQIEHWWNDGTCRLFGREFVDGSGWPTEIRSLSSNPLCVAGSLQSEQGCCGIAAFEMRDKPDGHALTVLEASLDAFAAALENQMRLDELRQLQNTAEADRHSLLQRMGRAEIQDRIVGQNDGLAQVMNRVNLGAGSNTSVLLLGPTGSGKEVIARAVHERSDRADGPFVRVNCGAIPTELIDSELFGHDKGSFTGAVAERRGWFERADGGTLLLDEVAELPPAAQVRLLRVLQEGALSRVGGEREIPVDVRVIAATHRDLAALVGSGEFREDLWYRIAVFPVRIPSLAERPEDIPALSQHLARRASQKLGLPLVLPTESNIEKLCAYDWPGNVREMASVLERAAILGDGETLELETALGAVSAPVPAAVKTTPDPASEPSGIQSLEEAMAAHIRQALRATSGRVDGPGGAAEALAMNPNTLRSRLRKLGIQPRDFR